MKKLFAFFLLTGISMAHAQELGQLTVEKIMRDPKWMGTSPHTLEWDLNSRNLYFNWNPERLDRDPLYQISVTGKTPVRAAAGVRQTLEHGPYVYSRDRSRIVFELNGDIVLRDAKSGKTVMLVQTTERESNPAFSLDESRITFQKGDNLYSVSLSGNALVQLTNFTRTKKRGEGKLSHQDQWLKLDQQNQFEIVRENEKQQKLTASERKETETRRPKEIYLEEKSFISFLQLSPDEKYITYRIIKPADGNKNTIVPNYVTSSGYTEDIPARTKVGNELSKYTSYIYDTVRDSVYSLSTKEIPGIRDLPDYLNDYPEKLAERKKKNEERAVMISGPVWNLNGTAAVVVVTAQDNKDRWIMKLDPSSGKLKLIDRQRDEAWIGGPGISGFGGGSLGWTDNDHIYYQSEASGYSHLYVADVNTGSKKQLTSGKYEVQSLRLSNDRKSFYFSANMEHPGITHYYRIAAGGGKPVRLTTMKGGNEVTISPDEKWLAIRYSYANKPWELFLQENKAGAKPVQVTSSTSAEFRSYPWREPDMVTFKNRHGDDVYARVYKPAKPSPSRPAVVFVHGAGYLQNVHYWWSQYFREYMFNNMLADNGYTVIDIDYTASSGYGRNHRTGIYRHMGGKDLTDQVDGVKMLVEKYGVNPENVGIYGGSYGGFITLMGLFNEPGVFKSGGALRSVTDWAHYNHGYTSNILNEPFNDEKAYRRSSPLYFAEGLKGNLLMCHGMVDVNVHFQDIVRLSQRLIELKKENWELAVYPVEDHGFVQPSSWTDEYKRIFKLFQETLNRSEAL
jgi:dipeptidyl aminopeptidase/acylaminoacyl peptidase